MTDFAATKAQFHLPEGMIYLDGNSLGPLPRATAARVAKTVEQEWGDMLITGWNKAGWMDKPMRVGDRIARLIGAEEGHVVMGDTLSIKVYQALASCLEMNPSRKIILSDTGNFPSDLYMAEGLCRTLGQGYELKTVAPEDVLDAIDETVAVAMITEVDYRTGRRHDMAAIAARAHEKGALAIWDLAHSAGAFQVELAKCNADFARPALSGWQGHAAPFAFDLDYRPATGAERMRVGTPPILQLAALEASLDIWDTVDMAALRKASLALQDQYIAGVEAACPTLTLATPRDHALRGSQVSFRHAQGYAIMQAMIARGVIGDFRAPDIIRCGFTPLFIDATDVARAIAIIADIMQNNLWDRPEYKTRAKVT